jgi:dsRNA-specific ribonuclease
MRAEEHSTRTLEFGEWKIRLTSYRLGETYHCSADNVDPGARLARAQGASREEAEDRASKQARKLLGRTRRRSAL